MCTPAPAVALAFAALLLAACSSTGVTSGSGGEGAATGSAVAVGSGSGAGGAGGAPDDCSALSAAIASQATLPDGTCTTIVRLDYLSKQILGFQLVCGAYALVDEPAALETAKTDTFYAVTDPPPEQFSFVSGPAPTDEFVFVAEPADQGAVAAVSARSGLSVFGGTIWFAGGIANIVWPQTPWQPAAALGPGCVSSILPPPARGYTLEINGAAGPLAAADVAGALDVVWHTALPDALVASGSLFDAMVLVYPRHVGDFDPTTAEWIVLVDSGSEP